MTYRGFTPPSRLRGTGNLRSAMERMVRELQSSVETLEDMDRFLAEDGSAASPSHSFINGPTTGLFRASAANIGIALGGSHVYQFTTSYFGGTVAGSIQIKSTASTVGAPGVTISGDSNSGIHGTGSDVIQIIAGGAVSAAFTTAATSIQTGTTGSAGNLHQASSGAAVNRFTSALKYKTELEDADWLADIELRPMKFYRDDDDRHYYGFIADWLGNQDELLGQYEDGEIEGYDANAVMAVLAAKIRRIEDERSRCSHRCA